MNYAFPFRLDPSSAQAAQTGYERHVEQMIRQVLLTAPGERVNRPEFGCGLRQLLFAPHREALDATTKLVVLQSLNRWLAGPIQVREVKVSPQQDGAGLLIQIDYLLVETQTNKRTTVRVLG
ncbi:GPW/gp25 family protein [Candidatus Cyanaurora vandensis]|uniref:GPW/gp25 family protein n=1 Tax=Candidatus Cyanaurora vandensis TaxID=2714958 RepID=UPI002579901C|nr:GPW/gp25 family protein [Candidatus Cyanaurora vandensis]